MTRLIRLYPSGFRDAYGDEVAAVYHEMTAGAGRVERGREAFGLVVHALRLRAGLGSGRPAGRLCGAAAPLVLAASAAYAGLELADLAAYATAVRAEGRPPAFFAGDMARAAAAAALVVSAVLALAGRWAAGRLWAAAAQALCGVLVLAVDGATPDGIATGGAGLLAAALLAACPPEVFPVRRARLLAGAAGAAVWLPLTALALDRLPVSTDYAVWPFLVLGWAGGLTAREYGGGARLAVASGATAAVPFAADAGLAWRSPLAPLAALLLLAVVASVASAAGRGGAPVSAGRV
ncbi:hypothetical protein AB0G74_24250 [Streptomyces sp. NPDC020875]|uniref:hypothetical protein n=1 Tax=Streptomyces sp. NPDC020875 TaxID=3154898 RepID=UPI0033DD3C5E